MSDYYPHAPVLLQYGPPAPPTASGRETAGQVLTVLASVLGPPAAAVTAFFASITWSGCFLSCSDAPDHTTGGLLWALAAGLLLLAPVLAATMVRKPTWVLAAIATPFVEVGLLFGLAHLHA
ncbi:MAG: hypothetical protein JWO22_2240 [Frankiales bacterium]|nr:hypothetical protein [Frankiales bacterium]